MASAAGREGLPGVTVLLTCYNHERYVETMLESIRAQTLRPAQLIVTDDASTDGSADRIAAWLATHWPEADFVRHETNTGLPRMLNETLPLVRHELLAFASADDWLRPDRLEREAAVLAAAAADVALVYSDMELIDEAGEPMGLRYYEYAAPPVEGDVFAAMLDACVPSSPTVMVRRDALVRLGPYDESLMFEDWDMWLRLSRTARIAYLPEPLVRYRRSASSLSKSEAFRLAFGEAAIHVLQKHVGVSKETDRIIARRVGTLARELYKKGRSPRVTASDLRFAMRRHPTPRGVVVLGFASARVPGPSVVRGAAGVRTLVRRR